MAVATVIQAIRIAVVATTVAEFIVAALWLEVALQFEAARWYVGAAAPVLPTVAVAVGVGNTSVPAAGKRSARGRRTAAGLDDRVASRTVLSANPLTWLLPLTADIRHAVSTA